MLLIQLVLDLNIRPSRSSSFWDESVAAHPAVHPLSVQRRLSPEPHFGIPAGSLLSHNGLKQLGVTIPIWEMWISSCVTTRKHSKETCVKYTNEKALWPQ